MNNLTRQSLNRVQIFVLFLGMSLMLLVLLSQQSSVSPKITNQNVWQLHEILRLKSGREGYSLRNLALSPDGENLVITTGYNNELWHLMDGRKQDMNLKGAGGYTPVVFFSGDQPIAAFADWATSLSFLDMETGQTIQRFVNDAQAAFMRDWNLSPDGQSLASKYNEQSFYIANLRTGERRFTLTPPRGDLFRYSNPTFNADGSILATTLKHGEKGFSWAVVLWNAVTGELIQTLGDFPDEGVPGSMAFSHDGKILAVAGGSLANANGRIASQIQLWNLASGEEMGAWLEQRIAPQVLAFTPDDHYLVAQTPIDIWVWDVSQPLETANMHLYLQGNGNPGSGSTYDGMALSDDGKLLAVGAPQNMLAVYDVATGQQLAQFKGGAIHDLAFSTDGRLLISGGDHTLRVWTVGDYNPFPTLGTPDGASLSAPIMTPTVPGS